MFKPKKNNHRLSKKQMVAQMKESKSFCKLCLTTPEGFVYNQYQQTCWCPRCGMPPVPLPKFMNKEKK